MIQETLPKYYWMTSRALLVTRNHCYTAGMVDGAMLLPDAQTQIQQCLYTVTLTVQLNVTCIVICLFITYFKQKVTTGMYTLAQ